MNETNGSINQSAKNVQPADEIAFQVSLLALSKAVEAEASRRSVEATADGARLGKRETSR